MVTAAVAIVAVLAVSNSNVKVAAGTVGLFRTGSRPRMVASVIYVFTVD